MDSKGYEPTRKFSEILFQVSSGVILQRSIHDLLYWLKEFRVLINSSDNDFNEILNGKWNQMLYKLVDLSTINGLIVAFKSSSLDLKLFKYSILKSIKSPNT